MKATRTRLAAAALALITIGSSARVIAWGAQGHRLVALLAAERLALMARRNVAWLLGPESLADEEYYRAHIPVVERRLALAGIRLAAALNERLTTPPPEW